MVDVKDFLSDFESAAVLRELFKMYLKRNKIWDASWYEVVGTRLCSKEGDVCDEYPEFDGDFVEVYIKASFDKLVTKAILFSDFLEWQDSRSKPTNVLKIR